MATEQQKILVVDDDPNIRELIKVYLEEEFMVKAVQDGNSLGALIEQFRPDLILLDIMLPGKSGFDICKEIRIRTGIPIIFLSAKGEEIDKVLGLEIGADDYITKPFSPREMLARVKAVLRRFRAQIPEEKANFVVFSGLKLDLASRTVTVKEQPVDLTLKEFEILSLMAGHPGKVFTREQLLNQVWGFDYLGDSRAVDSHIKRIRHKLEKVPGSPQYLHTVWGLGYKFEVAEN